MDYFIPLFGILAFFYAAVGHGGASAYLALMALLQFAPEEMKPLALFLNLCVSSLATWRFYRAGYFELGRFWPLILGSVPMAYVGGWVHLPLTMFKWAIAISLIWASVGLLYQRNTQESELRPMGPGRGIAIGAVLGLVSGLTGVGGGIYLSPILIWGRFATLKKTAALAAPFIFLNSASALLAQRAHLHFQPIWMGCAVAVILGGFAGSWLGVRLQKPLLLRVALAGVLSFSALKFVWI